MNPNTTNIVDIEKYATQDNFFAFTCITDIISKGVSTILLVASLAFFFYLVWGGLDWMLSGGDKTKVQNAQAKLSSALIGLTIIAVSWAVYLLVMYFLGIKFDSICTPQPSANPAI